MKQVYLEDLPKWKAGGNKGRINWNKSIGYKIGFLYNDIRGYFEITNYDKNKQKLEIKYNNNIHNIKTAHLKKGAIGNILGLINHEYVYKIGQIVKVYTGDIEIIDQISLKDSKNYNIRGYKYKCLNDEYIGEITESNLKNKKGCPVCNNILIIKGINDIGTSHPHLTTYFVNKDEVYKNSFGSPKEVKVICPDCKHEKKISINKLVNRGFSCRKCGDGISYAEKYVFNFLEKLNINFEIQKIFYWSDNKQYDFYLPELNVIIEAHGMQHYENNYSFSKNVKLKDIQKNDNYKMKLARMHQISNYIVLDCRKWENKWIKNQIKNSDLSKLLDLTKVNWLDCHMFACSSRVKEACDLWNDFSKDTKLISEKMKISRQTTIKYLKQGAEVGWCIYNPKLNMSNNGRNNMKKRQIPIIMYDKNNKILGLFESATEVSNKSIEKFGVKLSQSAISAVCRGRAEQHKGYKFKFFM